MNLHSRLRRLGLCALLFACANSWALDPFVGASASARVSFFSLICGTCPVDSGTVAAASSGGPGFSSARVADAASGWSFVSSATFGGPDMLPTLSAFALADVVVDSGPRTFFFGNTAVATAMQRFTYLGSTSQTYSVSYTIDGDFVLDGDDAASLMQVDGGLIVFRGDANFNSEVPAGFGHDFKNQNASHAGTEHFLLGGSVTFTVQPGEAFYVKGILDVTANSSHQVPGFVDASHTMLSSFTAGDTSLLRAEIAAVPEPGPGALWLAGLAVVGVIARRRA